jgi:hypothetical protein
MRGKPGMKSPTEFVDPNEWREYVVRTVPAEDVAYALAFGRTVLFARFYEVRNQTFPLRFCAELAGIVSLQEPEKTHSLEALNGRIFADMRRFLAASIPPKPAEVENMLPVAEGELIDSLLDYLAKENPYFRIWTEYAEQTKQGTVGLSWHQFVTNRLAPSPEDEIEFAQLMGQLGNLLHQFRAQKSALPPHHFSRLWFLHYLRGAERIMQTGALVQALVEAISPCACA